MICKKCGTKFTVGMFCPECGTEFAVDMFCPECGTKVLDGAGFCQKCGFRLREDDEASQISDKSNVDSSSTSVEKADISGKPFSAEEFSAESVPAKQISNFVAETGASEKKKFWKLPVILGGVVLVAALAVFGVSRFVNRGKQAEEDEIYEEYTADEQGEEINLSETYINEEEEFSFCYPGDWTIETIENIIVNVSAPVEPSGFSANIGVLKSPADETYFTAAKSELEEVYLNFASLENFEMVSVTDLTLSGHDARKLFYKCNDSKNDYLCTQYFYIVDSDMYFITCIALENNFDKYEPIFDSIMDSYTIMESDSAAINSEFSYDGQSASAADGHKEGAYYIGDIASMSQTNSSGEIGYFDITMTNWGTYKPKYIDDTYVYVTFEIVNTGNADIFISEFSFSAYVNNYNVDIGWPSEDNSLSATLSSGRRTSGNVYIRMNPEDVNQLELELGDIIFILQDNSLTEEIPFGYEGEESYTDYIEWGGVYADGWMDTSLTFSLYSDGSQDPECGYMTTNFRGMESTGELYYLGGNQFRWESGGYESIEPEIYYVYAVYKDQEYQLDLYNDDGEYEVTFTLYEQYIP